MVEGLARAVAKAVAAEVSPSRKVTALWTLTEPAVILVMATSTLAVDGRASRMAVTNCSIAAERFHKRLLDLRAQVWLMQYLQDHSGLERVPCRVAQQSVQSLSQRCGVQPCMSAWWQQAGERDLPVML